MSTMSATVHGFGVSDAYIVKYGRKYLCAKWLAFTLHDRVFALAAALIIRHAQFYDLMLLGYFSMRKSSIHINT